MNTRRGKRRANATGRSQGEPRFVQLPYWVLESERARLLSGTAFKVLVYLLKRFNGSNNGRIAFGLRSGCFARNSATGEIEDRSLGLGKSAVGEALRELDAAGFIRCETPSSFGQKRLTREWRVTWLEAAGKLPTKDFVIAAVEPKNYFPVRQGGLCSGLQSGMAERIEPKLVKTSATVRQGGL